MSVFDAISAELANLFNTLLGNWFSSDRLFKLTTTLGPETFIVERINGIESVFGAPLPDSAHGILPNSSLFPVGSLVDQQLAVPQPTLGHAPSLKAAAPDNGDLLCGYRFELTVLSSTSAVDINSLLGTPVLLEMQTALSRTELRPFHGYITQAEYVASNGGLVKYRFIIEPWLGFLRLKRDSWSFQDLNIPDILEAVFNDYANQGQLVPDFRFELQNRDIYPRRSLVTQYRETDWHFVARLMQSEGLFGWFEHTASPDSASLGKHTFVISDRESFDRACKLNPESPIRFHRADSTEKSDSVQIWNEMIASKINEVKLSSYDYRTRSSQTVSAQLPSAAQGPRRNMVETVGHYTWVSTEDGERRALNLLSGFGVQSRHILAGGTNRTWGPGQVFELKQHECHPGPSRFRTVSVHHQGRNNVSADMLAVLAKAFPEAQQPSHLDADFYHNRAIVLFAGAAVGFAEPIDTPYAPYIPRLFDKPTASGTQTATVVGLEGAVIDTDRNHRVKVQYHWQRGQGSHNRLSPPTEDDNAPANERSSTWVRVGAALTGVNFGSSLLPRIGQEVIISFMGGDIDRPLICGAVYNGEGNEDAQHNQNNGQTGRITGNAPAWFAGENGEHAHPDVISGIKTQAMSFSQDGTGGYSSGGYNQLVFDDTPKQNRLELATTQAATQLQLGHLKHQADNAHREGRGHGINLETTAFGAVRAGQGLLLTTNARYGGSGSHLESQEALATLQVNAQGQSSLIDQAQQHKANLLKEPKPGELPLEKTLFSLQESIAATEKGSSSGEFGGGEGLASAWNDPHLVMSSPVGIGWLTPGCISLGFQQHNTIISQDVSMMAQGTLTMVTTEGLRVFSYGKKAADAKPEQSQGLRFHAATGKAVVQAQKDKAHINAQKSVSISSNAKVEVSSPTQCLMIAGGTGLELKGGNITITTPGAALFKAAAHSQTGPASASHSAPALPNSKLKACPEKS